MHKAIPTLGNEIKRQIKIYKKLLGRFSRGELKISKQSNSLGRLDECSKSKPLYCIALIF